MTEQKHKASQATPNGTLLEQIMDPCQPKSEREWAAKHEIERLRADAARLDWLADKDNHIGNVELPSHCITANMHSLRAAIDAAMAMKEKS